MAQPRTPPTPAAGQPSRTWLPDLDRLTIPGRAEQVAVAREFVAKALVQDHPLADTAVLLTFELVTNSLRHSESSRDGGSITITLAHATENPGLLRVEVTDDGARGLPTRRAPGSEDESGYGLRLVDALATRWGCRSGHDGATTTWFEITS